MPSIINRRGRPPYPDILTPSEWQVLEGVRAGLTNQEIAVRLGVTFHTVKYHISNMLSKLHLEDRQQLAAWRPVARAILARISLVAEVRPGATRCCQGGRHGGRRGSLAVGGGAAILAVRA
jgi:DNA-binding CsgD family transcriptional regulator